MIRASGLRKVFNRGTASERVALAGVDLAASSGEFIAVVGGNGAGKSTLLNLICGALSCDGGSIEIDRLDVTRATEHLRARWIARVFQDPMVGTAPSLTVEENLTLALMRAHGRGLRPALTAERRSQFQDVLLKLHLGLESRLKTTVNVLSGGQRQALALAMATLAPPKLLLLDEHTAALDPRTSQLVMDATAALVSGGSLTTLMVTHNMEHALTYSSRIVIMDGGHIVADIDERQKADMSVADLVERFSIKDDRIMLRQTGSG